ncbi:MAG: FHA domain-containing protein [Planctomycetota bacterium]
MPILHAWSEQHGLRSFALEPGTLVVGRAPGCDIALPEERCLSRHHLRVEVGDDGSVFITDLETSNGTLFGARRIGRREVNDSDIFMVEQLHLQFRLREDGPCTISRLVTVPVYRGGDVPEPTVEDFTIKSSTEMPSYRDDRDVDDAPPPAETAPPPQRVPLLPPPPPPPPRRSQTAAPTALRPPPRRSDAQVAGSPPPPSPPPPQSPVPEVDPQVIDDLLHQADAWMANGEDWEQITLSQPRLEEAGVSLRDGLANALSCYSCADDLLREAIRSGPTAAMEKKLAKCQKAIAWVRKRMPDADD